MPGRQKVCDGRRGVRVKEAGKVAVQALVAGDELVGEGEAVHEAALLEPEDRAEAAPENIHKTGLLTVSSRHYLKTQACIT